MSLTPLTKNNDPNSVRRAIQRLSSLKLGSDSSPTFVGLTLSGLTASRLLGTDASKNLESVSDLTSWIAGTSNRITVADDGDGTVTLSTPQDIHTAASPEFAGMTFKDSGGNVAAYIDEDIFYVVEVSGAIVTGNPIGLLLTLTYTV